MNQVLAFCNASPGEYLCVFTSGATSALKLVGETFPWSAESEYWYTVENHNSVLGIREYALDQGVAVSAVDVQTNLSSSQPDFTLKPRALEQRTPLSTQASSGTFDLTCFLVRTFLYSVCIDISTNTCNADSGDVIPG